MEVHKHPQHVTHKKKWSEYFLEFFMLFLAVFLGFIAENVRERYVEHRRARELAKNLYKELSVDSIKVAQSIASRNIKESECAYLIDHVKDSNLTNLSAHFFPAFARLFQLQYVIFDPNDGILNQLRNSGELRYFKNSELQAEISNLGVQVLYVRDRNDREYSYIETYIRPFVIKYFDFSWLEEFIEHGKLSLYEALNQKKENAFPGNIPDVENLNRHEAEGLISYYRLILRSTRQVYYKDYPDANHHVLELLRKEYHIE